MPVVQSKKVGPKLITYWKSSNRPIFDAVMTDIRSDSTIRIDCPDDASARRAFDHLVAAAEEEK